MWPFLFILAIFPLFFFWGDSVQELFPKLAHYFPDKNKTTIDLFKGQVGQKKLEAGEPNKWFTSETSSGFLAWTISGDSEYRLAVGCHAGAEPVIQLTAVDQAVITPRLELNFQYGKIRLTGGSYFGQELVASVAQFGNVYLQDMSTAVIAQFQVPASESNAIARGIEQNCTTSGDQS